MLLKIRRFSNSEKSHKDLEAKWLTKPGADYFEINWFESNSGIISDGDKPLKHFPEFSGTVFKQKVKPVQGYVMQLRSVGVDYFGNITYGEWRTQHIFSEFPPLTKLSFDDLGCDTADYSWANVGYNASYKIELYDMDRNEGVATYVTRNTKYQIAQMKNANKYMVSIYAFNNNTRGDEAEAGFITELCPPDDVHSPHQEDTALEIEWTAVHLADYYRIKIHPPPSDGYVEREGRV